MKTTRKSCLLFVLATILILSTLSLVACDYRNDSKVSTPSLQVNFDNEHIVYSTDNLDSLKPYLSVKYTDENGSVFQISDYTLDGTISTGTVKINVSYNSLTTSFWINVVERESVVEIKKISQNENKKFSAYIRESTNESNDVLNYKNSLNYNDEYYLFCFYLGNLRQTPIFSSLAYQYTVDRTISLGFSNFTEETLSNNLSRVTESVDMHEYKGGFSVDASLNIKNIFSLKANTEHKWTNNWGETITVSENKANTLINQASVTNNETVNMCEEAGFIRNNYYRMAIYETVSVYGVLVYDVKQNCYSVTVKEFLTSSPSQSVWEESEDGTFDYQQDRILNFDAEQAISFVEKNKLIDDLKALSKENPDRGDTVHFMGGKGTEENPYLIGNIEQFSNIRLFPTAHYLIVSDIDANGYQFVPIPDFSGVLDGGKHTLHNLEMEKTEHNSNIEFGIFETMNGNLKNLRIVDSKFIVTPKFSNSDTTIYLGAIAAKNNGTISNCELSKVTVVGNSNNIAELFESTYGQNPRNLVAGEANFKEWIHQSFNVTTDNWIEMLYQLYIGGLVGQNNGNIDNIIFNGDVEGNLFHMASYSDKKEQVCVVGGVVGQNSGSVNSVNISGNVSAWIEMDHDAGGMGWVNTVSPKGLCLVGGIAGNSSNSSVRGIANATLSARYRIYVAVYWLFSGAGYGKDNKGNANNLTIKTSPIYSTR